MSNLRTDKQLLVAACGMMSSLLTGVILGLIEVYTGFAFYSLMFWFVIPTGALLSGFAAASGYYGGAIFFNQKPAGGVLFNMVVASISTFFIVHYIPFYMLEIDGTHVKEIISFWQYLDLDIRNSSLSFVRGEITTGELGSVLGYAFAVLQLVGFSVVGFAVFMWLSQNAYCDKCSRYLKKTGMQERYTSDSDIAIKGIGDIAALVDSQKFDEAIRFHAEEMGIAGSRGHHLRTSLIARKCLGCNINQLDFIAYKREGNVWKEIDGTHFRNFTEKQLNLVDNGIIRPSSQNNND